MGEENSKAYELRELRKRATTGSRKSLVENTKEVSFRLCTLRSCSLVTLLDSNSSSGDRISD